MTTNQHHEELEALQDAICIYKEKSLIRLVRVTNLRIDEWGVTFGLEAIPAPGFIDDERKEFLLSCCWEYLDVSDGRVSASGYIGWCVIYRPDLVDRIKKVAEKNTDLGRLMFYVSRAGREDPDWTIDDILRELGGGP